MIYISRLTENDSTYDDEFRFLELGRGGKGVHGRVHAQDEEVTLEMRLMQA